MPSVTINATTIIGESSPLILSANRNHVDNQYHWRNGNTTRPGVIAAMKALKTTWGSTTYGTNTTGYRLGHGPTDGRLDYAYMTGYHYEKVFNLAGPYPYDDIKYGLNEAVEMGATPIMVVNIGTGTDASEAGRLAAYCNRASNTQRSTYNAARASLPYNVKYWEMGNEISWATVRGHSTRANTETVYAKYAAPYAAAIRANSDIAIKAGFVLGTNSNFMGDGWTNNDPAIAARNIIQNSTASGTQQADAFVFHGYPSWPVSDRNSDMPQKLATYQWQSAKIAAVKGAITTYSSKPMELWNTEFFAHYYSIKDQSFSGFVYLCAGQIHAINHAIPIANSFCMWHNTNNSDEVLFYQGTATQKTAHYAWNLILSQNWGSQTVSALMSSDTPNVTITGLTAAGNTTYKSVMVCASKSADKLYLMFLNMTQATPVSVTLNQANVTGWNFDDTIPMNYQKIRSTNRTTWFGGWNEYATNAGTIAPSAGTYTFNVEAMCAIIVVIPLQGSTPPPPPASPSLASFFPTSGVAGDVLTINGANLPANAGLNNVTIGGTPATVLSATTTQLTVQVPNGASTGSVIDTIDGVAYAAPGAFTVNTIPTPVMTNVTPLSGPPGTTVTISGTNFGTDVPSTKVLFNSVQGTVLTVTPTQVTAVVPNAAADGPITMQVRGFVIPATGSGGLNMLSNSGFEAGGTGWTALQGASVQNIAGRSGVWRGKLTHTAAQFADHDRLYQFVNGINPGTSYVFQCQANELVAQLGTFRLMLDWYNGSTYLASASMAEVSPAIATYNKQYVVGVAPTGTTRVRATVYANKDNAMDLAVDELMLEIGTVPSIYDETTVGDATFQFDVVTTGGTAPPPPPPPPVGGGGGTPPPPPTGGGGTTGSPVDVTVPYNHLNSRVFINRTGLDGGEPYYLDWAESDWGEGGAPEPTSQQTAGGNYTVYPLYTSSLPRRGKITLFAECEDQLHKRTMISRLSALMFGEKQLHLGSRFANVYFRNPREVRNAAVTAPNVACVEAEFQSQDAFWRLNQPLRGVVTPINMGTEWALFDDQLVPSVLPAFQFTNAAFVFSNWGTAYTYASGTISAGPANARVYLAGNSPLRVPVDLDASGNGTFTEGYEFRVDVGNNTIRIEDATGTLISVGAGFLVDLGDTYLRFL